MPNAPILVLILLAALGIAYACVRRPGPPVAARRQEAAAFLAANGAKPGVVTLPSGLQYRVLTAGSGRRPAAGDRVTVNYRGRLIDGTGFDSSFDRGEPATFPVSGVIAGWSEALQLMPEGSSWELVIPAGLAYGASGAGPIPPDATLIFQVDLLAIR
jgi:FKBP-type peptidyl-prolyl cis-trans isomerase